MKTVMAMVLGSLFLANAAIACPGEGGAHKDQKTADSKGKTETKDKKTTT
ncbi:MAG TPA: hypothetical protein PKI49_05525 [Pseudomonadota bacterium]|jgi:hypothetical protein|nr:hypothetical protein [Pseudomonadota bacterium]HNI59166.1 hypothetical protein [Pseudomonadota bacterium]HNK43304.1 hypothetical protein [Pseudomonadota bacterium]HNN51693.1 hypothetical protein [Pseudomonadota bacterium]HNO67950.1 hypothetical protein [Pseudomonadota bacterium]